MDLLELSTLRVVFGRDNCLNGDDKLVGNDNGVHSREILSNRDPTLRTLIFVRILQIFDLKEVLHVLTANRDVEER